MQYYSSRSIVGFKSIVLEHYSYALLVVSLGLLAKRSDRHRLGEVVPRLLPNVTGAFLSPLILTDFPAVFFFFSFVKEKMKI